MGFGVCRHWFIAKPLDPFPPHIQYDMATVLVKLIYWNLFLIHVLTYFAVQNSLTWETGSFSGHLALFITVFVFSPPLFVTSYPFIHKYY